MRSSRTITLPLWQFAALSFVTAGIFKVYWFFRTWKFIRDREHTKVNPAWGAARMMVPVLNLFISYTFFRKTYHVARRTKENRLLTIVSVGLFMIGQALILTHWWWIGIVIGYAPLMLCQYHLNQLRRTPRVSNHFQWSTADKHLCLIAMLMFAPFSFTFAIEMLRRALGLRLFSHMLIQKIFWP